MNYNFTPEGNLVSVRKNKVIRNVAYITQLIGDQLITVQLCPPRNVKITNNATKQRRRKQA